MHKKPLAIATLLGLATMTTAAASQWRTYRSDTYGFTMLVPQHAKLIERERSGGWAGLYGEHEGVEFFALTKKGEHASAEAIERFAVRETSIPGDAWALIDEGANEKGWKWFRVYRAEHRGRVVFGAAGTGPKGSYLLLLRTTASDFEAHRTEYTKWYESVAVY